MNNAYDKDLRELAHAVAAQKGYHLQEGVYAMVGGPQFETPAECRLLSNAGADAVGMSVCHETIVARHCDIKVLAMTLVTNISIIDCDFLPTVNSFHEEVLEEGRKATECVSSLVKGIVSALQ